MTHEININGTTDKKAVRIAYGYIQRDYGCTNLSLSPNQSGGLTMSVDSNSAREDIVNALNEHLPSGAYAGCQQSLIFVIFYFM